MHNRDSLLFSSWLLLLVLLFYIFEHSSGAEPGCGKLYSREGADKGEWPWKVSLYLVEPGSRKYRCGASLISQNYVVTSARCVTLANTVLSFANKNLEVLMGAELSTSDLVGPHIQKFTPSEIIVHEKFDPGTTGYDIALLRLDRPAEINQFVHPICLWEEDINISNVLQRTGTISGYETQNGIYRNEQSDYKVETIQTCQNAHPVFLISFELARTLCAGAGPKTRTCPAQTGSGLYFTKTNNPEVWQLRALKSTALYSHGVGAECGETDYVLFVDVAQYNDWIKKKINNENKDSNAVEEEENTFAKRGCGRVPTKAQPLIRHGQNTSIEDWPWHVAIYRLVGPDLTYSCGGTLIADQYVLTAAHCITEIGGREAIELNKIQVYLGINKLRELGAGIQVQFVSELVVHPDYNQTTFYNDIGLIKLQKKVLYSKTVWPICLWESGEDIAVLYGKYGTVVGWGVTEKNAFSNQLQKAQFPVVSITTCLASDRLFFSTYIFRNNFCAGYLNGTSACSGDSGGGMFFESDTKAGVWYLRGMISVGAVNPGTRKCHNSHFILLTDVAQYLVWVKHHMVH